MEDATALIEAVQTRTARRKKVVVGASAAIVTSAVVVGMSVARTGHHGAPAARGAEIADLSRAPLCPLPAPFAGFAPNTDSTTVTRIRGTVPTRLAAHARVADLSLADVRVELVAGARVVRSAELGAMHTDGQDLSLTVGDVADDGSAIAPGRYEVFVSASVTGRDICGAQATHQVSTRAGLLVIR
jgi:hypothetical protein